MGCATYKLLKRFLEGKINMALIDGLKNDDKRQMLVADCMNLLETRVANIGGISGIAIKAGYATIKGISPKYCAGAVERLLPESFAALEPLWNEGLETGDAVTHLTQNRSRTADAIFSVTDIRIEKALIPPSRVFIANYECQPKSMWKKWYLI